MSRTPSLPPNRLGRWANRRRGATVLAFAGPAAAAANLAAAHASGLVSPMPGVPVALLDVPFLALFAAVDADFAIYLAAFLLAFQRPNPLGAALSAGLAAAPFAFSAAKSAFLGASALFGGLFLLGDLARSMGVPPAAAATGLAIAAALAFAINARPIRPRRALLDAAPHLVAGSVLAAASASPGLSAGLAALVPARMFDIPIAGHVVNAYAELLTSLDWRHALDGALMSGVAPPRALEAALVVPLEQRNVHLVVVESLMDPAWLGGGFAFSPAGAPSWRRTRRASRGRGVSPPA